MISKNAPPPRIHQKKIEGPGKPLFKGCGRNVNVESKAYFGSGSTISIGDNSGIEVNAFIWGCVLIGKDVMTGNDVMIIGSSHEFWRTDIPMIEQGFQPDGEIKIGNDVWIGSRAVILSRETIGSGAIMRAATIGTKNPPGYTTDVGKPAKVNHYPKKSAELGLRSRCENLVALWQGVEIFRRY